MSTTFQPVVVIPHFNHSDQLIAGLPAICSLGIPILIVDDGSAVEQRDALLAKAAGLKQVDVVAMPRNRGKGAAVKTGLLFAASRGYSHALQIDADGQHAAEDGAGLLACARDHPAAVICGLPVFDESIPKARLRGRLLTIGLNRLQTLGGRVRDSMCGFRVYPLAVIEPVLDRLYTGPRMDFDIEVLVKVDWVGIPLLWVPTRVIYPEGGISHFNYLKDNVDITLMHIRLIVGMLPRAGKLLWRLLPGVGR